MASFGAGAMIVTMLTIFGAYFKFAWQGRGEVTDVDKSGAQESQVVTDEEFRQTNEFGLESFT